MQNLAIIGLQWGDEGKGKIIDYLADRFDAVVRYNGGSNAGHTVVTKSGKYTFHLIPSGALKGKKLLIGAGVTVDPIILNDEIELIKRHGINADVLIDGRCTLVTPFDKELDISIEEMRGGRMLGTTRRGIGPSYAMRALRLAPRAIDTIHEFDYDSMLRFYERILGKKVRLEDWLRIARSVFKDRLCDASSQIYEINERGGSVLFEGSQGTLLDILYGSYPYVTSSHTLSSYIATSLGLPGKYIGKVMGVVKCYTTRVGGGPFPTEIGDGIADSIRKIGNEYGATTGRPRRIGWLDLVALRYAIRVNGVDEIILSKLDVLAKIKDFKICTAYELDGEEIRDFYKVLGAMDNVVPLYDNFSIDEIEIGNGISGKVKDLIDFIEKELDVNVSIISYGEERERTIEL